MNMATIMRGVKFATCVVAALAIAGCAKQQADQIATSAGTAAPGSQQDFVVNIGDRVFFETDSSELTSRAREMLDKQALWLNHYNSLERFLRLSSVLSCVALGRSFPSTAGQVGDLSPRTVALHLGCN